MLNRRLLSLVLACALAIAYVPFSFASQGSGCLPTTGTISGLVFAQDTNAALAALISSNSGASAPATDCTAVPIKGQVWLDTSTTPNIVKQYDGANWLIIGYLDASNAVWTPPVGGGTATLASASTTNLGSVPQSYVTVSGTTTVSSFGSSAATGTVHFVKFSGALTLSYNASSMILPGAADIVTAAGDTLAAVHLGAGNWQVLSFTKGDGTAVVNPARDVGDIWYSSRATAPAKAVLAYGQALSRASYPEYTAAVTVTQSSNRISGSAIISASDTSLLGAGMPIEGTGIPAGTTILSVTSSSITMSANASSSGAATSTAFLTGYGAGGSSTTVGVMDCSGYVLAGRTNLSGTAATTLDSAASINATLGSKTQTLTMGQLPASPAPFSGSGSTSYTPTLNGSQAALGLPNGASPTVPPGTGGPQAYGPGSYQAFDTATITIAITSNSANLGSGQSHPIVQPTKTANCFVRVLP